MTSDNSESEQLRAELAALRKEHEQLLERCNDGTVENRCCQLVENSPDPTIRFDRDLRQVYVNKAAEHVLGMHRGEIIGRMLCEIGVPEHICTVWESNLRLVFETGQEQDIELNLVPDRPGHTFHVRNVPEWHLNKVQSVVSVTRDVTRFKCVEAELQARTAEMAAVMDSIPALVFVSRDRKATRMEANRHAYELLRVPFGMNLSASGPLREVMPWRPHINGRPAEPHELPMQRAAAEGEPVRGVELEFAFEDAPHRWVYGNAVPLKDASGQVRGSVGGFVDITELKHQQAELHQYREHLEDAVHQAVAETQQANTRLQEELAQRRRAEAALEARERQLRAVLASAPLILLGTDTDGNVTVFDGRGLHVLGLEPGALVGQNVVDVLDRQPLTAEHLRLALMGHSFVEREHYGKRVWEARYAPVHDEWGAVSGAVVVAVDVTENVEAQQNLARERELLKTVLDNIPVMLAVFGPEGGARIWNREMAACLGFNAEEAERFDYLAQLYPDAAQRERARLQMEQADGKWQDYRMTRRSGEQMSASWAHVRLSNGSLVAIGIDVTERERREQEFAALVEHSPDLVVRFDHQRRLVYANPAMEKATGEAADGWTGKTLREAGVPAPTAEALARAVEQVLAHGRQVDLELNYPHPDSERSYALRLVPERNSTPRVGSVLMVGRETTEQRHAEEDRELLREQLAHSQKLEAIGRLAGGIAHDFNNLMMVVLGWSQRLIDHVPEGQEKQRKGLTVIHQAGSRAAGLTRQLLAFSRKQVLQLEVLDLGEEARQVGQMLPRVLSEDIRLEIDVPDEPVWVKADASQLEQVLLNLAINARDAMPRGGELMISAERVDYDGELGARMPELATGPYGVLRVRDTGEGIDPQIASQIFEPFFTTKAPGEGTGLGLSTVHGIVKQSGGDISVESKLGEGTVFSIYLPLAEMPLEAPAPEEAAALQVPQAGTVLVVEDEEGVRQVVEMDLREMGFTVLSASDLPQALALSRAHPGRIDLLLTDVVLPGGDGTQVHDAIAAERPDIRVLYMSGYAQSQIARRQGWDARAPFLEKPFRPGQLADKVKQVLMM